MWAPRGVCLAKVVRNTLQIAQAIPYVYSPASENRRRQRIASPDAQRALHQQCCGHAAKKNVAVSACVMPTRAKPTRSDRATCHYSNIPFTTPRSTTDDVQQRRTWNDWRRCRQRQALHCSATPMPMLLGAVSAGQASPSGHLRACWQSTAIERSAEPVTRRLSG